MRVLDGWCFGADVDAVLDDLAPGDAKIVPLQIGTPQSRRLPAGISPPEAKHPSMLTRCHPYEEGMEKFLVGAGKGIEPS
jgi:hypothetical protein